MSETMQLVPIKVNPSEALLPTEREMMVVEKTAQLVLSGAIALPAELNTVEKVAAVILYGLELGLKPMTALQNLYIVKGKVSASAQVMAGLCMSKERDISFHTEQLDSSICTIRMLRPSRRVDALYTVTWEQIKRAGLASGNNLQYPEDRLTYHCMKRLCRTYAPDLINGLDEGVAVPGVTEPSQWREQPIDLNDLYNDEDAPVPALAQDNPEQDEDAGVESVPLATDEQLVSMGEWSQAMKDHKDGRAMVSELARVRVERWPYAVSEANKFEGKRLTKEDAEAFIALMADIVEGRHELPTTQQPSLVT